MTKIFRTTLAFILASGITAVSPALAQTDSDFNQAQDYAASGPPQLVLPDPSFNAGQKWLGRGYTPLMRSIPGLGASYIPSISGIGVPGIGIPSISVPGSLGIPGVPSIPYVGSVPGIGAISRLHAPLSGSVYASPYTGYSGLRTWNNFGSWSGLRSSSVPMGIPSSGRLSSTTVIQTAPSKASGNYYAPPTRDSHASGSYYAGTGNNSYFGSGAYGAPYRGSGSGSSMNSPSQGNWGASGNPFPKDLNSTPWAGK